MRSALIAATLLSGVHTYRVKRGRVSGRADVESELLKRSSALESLEGTKQLDEAVTGKERSTDGWCWPHQQCTYSDCCVWRQSCKTCPGGSSYHTNGPFDHCGWKGFSHCKPMHCQGEWSEWNDCSADCGGGHQEKYFTVTHLPSEGGDACPEPRVQRQECNTHECSEPKIPEARDQRRERQEPRGKSGVSESRGKSAPIECQGHWSGEWSECSASCGGGTQTMQFVVSAASQYDGAECEESKTQACNEQSCEELVDEGGDDTSEGELADDGVDFNGVSSSE